MIQLRNQKQLVRANTTSTMKGLAGISLLAILFLVLHDQHQALASYNKHKEKHAHPHMPNKHKLKHAHKHTAMKRFTDFEPEDLLADQGNNAQALGTISPFDKSGKEHCFSYNGQIASGYSPQVSSQRAMIRVETKACISLQQQSQAVLRLENTRFGQSNEEWFGEEEQQSPRTIRAMHVFRRHQPDVETSQKMTETLELPVTFNLLDGCCVERLIFNQKDEPWSKNLKKAILNMLQMTQNPNESPESQNNNNQDQDNQKQGYDSYDRISRSNRRPDRFATTYRVMETTVEGTCKATYSVLSAPLRGKASGNDQDQNQSQNQAAQVNVTKTIDFDRCDQVADIGYGFQVDPIQWWTPKKGGQAWTQSPRVIPREKLDRSTTMRYVMEKKDGSYELKRVELLSEYVLRSSEAETNQAMQTTVVAELVFTGSRSAQPSSSENNVGQEADADKEETLVYNAEAEKNEKLFYMYGDGMEQNRGYSSPAKSMPGVFERKQQQHRQRQQRQQQGGKQQQQQEGLQQTETALVQEAEQHLQALTKEFEDSEKNAEIEPMQSTERFERLVQLMRLCTVEELRKIDEKCGQIGGASQQNKDQKVAAELFADALAVAATRNTILVLTKKIENEMKKQPDEQNEIKWSQVLKILGRGSGLHAISNAQTNEILTLCKSDSVQRSTAVLKQSCWLTFGTMVGELMLQNRMNGYLHAQQLESPTQQQEISEDHQLVLYKEVFEQNLKNVDNTNLYEKILVLKAIGNAGLPSTLKMLKEVAHDKRQPALVRVNSIIAMRRIRHHWPEKVQEAVLPLYENIDEKPEIRMTAFELIMKCRPSKPIVDQIIFTMLKDKCEEVQGFVYSIMKTAAKSPVPEERECADHLRNVMKLAQIDEQEFERKQSKTASRRYTAQFFSYDSQEGAFLNQVDMFSKSEKKNMPTHYSIGLDSFFNGHFNRDVAKMTICQKDWQKVLKELFNFQYTSEQNTDEDRNRDDNNQTDSDGQSGIFARATRKIRDMIGQKRSRANQQDDESEEKQSPFIVFSFRLNDVDVAIVPLHSGDGPSSIRRATNALAESLRQMFSRTHMQKFQLTSAALLNSRKVVVPTSLGLSLRTTQSMYLMGQLKTHLQAEKNGYKIKLHPNGNWIQTQKMEVCAYKACAGVQSTRTVSVNWPITLQTEKKNNKEYILSLRVPQNKTRLLAVRTLPITYLRDASADVSGQMNDENGMESMSFQHHQRVKTVHSEELEGQTRQVKKIICEQCPLRVPVQIYGHYQEPRDNSLDELLKVIMTGDNDVVVEIDNEDARTPEQIAVKMSWEPFRVSSTSPISSIRSKITNFFAKRPSTQNQKARSVRRDSDEDESDEEGWYGSEIPFNKEHQSRQYKNHLDKFEGAQKTNYQHSVKFQVQTLDNGRTNKVAELELESVCDARFRACQATYKLESSLSQGNNNKWQSNGEVQTLYPEHVSSIQDLLREDTTASSSSSDQLQIGQQHQFFCHANIEWGMDNSDQNKQSIEVNLQGKPSARMIEEVQQQIQQRQKRSNTKSGRKSGRNNGKNQRQSSANVLPFIDQYEAVADYTLSRENELGWENYLAVLKTRNFFNTRSRIVARDGQDSCNSNGNGNNRMCTGQTEWTIKIDPHSARVANISIRTPYQHVSIRDKQLPVAMRPMCLIRDSSASSPAHSTGHVFQNMLQQRRSSRAQCKVGVKTVDTFDGVAYKAPISKCYTVLANDCSNREHPKFSVLMKSIQTGGEEKKIKVIAPGKMISVEQKTNNNQMLIKCNGKIYTVEKNGLSNDQEIKLQEQGIIVDSDYHQQEGHQRMVIIDLGSVAVKFNGRTATIQLDDEYKNLQCGLCGNFNDDTDDELRNTDNELTSDVKSFHESYALQDDEECREEERKQFYSDKDNVFEYEQKQKNGKQQQGDDDEDQDQDSEEEQQSMESKPRTLVMEYPHKLCFSMRPVKQCPDGWLNADDQQEERAGNNNNHHHKRSKIPFVCLNRYSIEAKRLNKLARKNKVQYISDYASTFAEQVVIPERCVRA
jgi:hypothetical protein